jgi:hypothetical protein
MFLHLREHCQQPLSAPSAVFASFETSCLEEITDKTLASMNQSAEAAESDSQVAIADPEDSTRQGPLECLVWVSEAKRLHLGQHGLEFELCLSKSIRVKLRSDCQQHLLVVNIELNPVKDGGE